MAISRLTTVYKLIKEVNLDSENIINSDILCTICNKILINAHFAPCGCRYCLECITAYLDGEDKYCPGDTDDCNIDLLNIDNNILIDNPINIKISKLIVKCPKEDCDEKFELRKLEDHIRVCNWKPTNCPFFNVGCRNVQMTNDTIEQHLLSDNHAHTKLLMDCIDVLRNEFGEMSLKVKYLSEEVKEKQLVIDKLRAIIAQQSREIDRLSEEMVAVGNVNRQMTEKINDVGTKVESCETDLELMHNEVKQMSEMNDKLEQMKREDKAIRINHDQMSIQIRQISAQTAAMKAKSDNDCRAIKDDVDVKISKLDEKMMAMAARQNQMNYYGEFVWPIDNFPDKRQKAQNGVETEIFSESFFSHKNGYKMCLSVHPNGDYDCRGTHLSVFLNLMRGPFDNILQWPFKCDVTFSLINQQSRLSDISDTIKPANTANCKSWKKPISDMNEGFGYPQFIKLNELLRNSALTRNNRIFIKCEVQTI